MKLNCIDVAVFTETWETVDTLGNLDFSNYNMFHHIRKDCKKSSGGLSIFVKDHIPATKLSVDVPNNLEVLYVSIRPHKLPRSISNIILCGVYYPGSKSVSPPLSELVPPYCPPPVRLVPPLGCPPLPGGGRSRKNPPPCPRDPVENPVST